MKTRNLAGLGLSALLLGGTMVGCTHGGVATASSKSDAAAQKQAAANAEKASRALAKGEAAKAVSFAEAAVALRPADQGYRMLLAGSYLKAGRFGSAHTAYADVLSLQPGNAKAALNLALAQIAIGQWDAARATLDANAQIIPASDRGLAIALAGDPVAGAELLLAAARSDGADAKTRQNLGLALALAGRWNEARAVVAVDLAPLEADHRILQWATFAKPVAASDQVAALLGVTPAEDPGRPVALALVAPVPVAPEPIAPVVQTASLEEPAIARVVPPAMVRTLPVAAAPTIVAKGAFKTKLAAVPVPAKPAAAAPKPLAKGNWYVQLGAYDSAGVAKDAWARAQRRYTAFAGQSPTGMAFKSHAGAFYRLSVGGFARGDADAMCRGYRAKGGACFVRAGAGDQVASWVKPTRVMLASR